MREQAPILAPCRSRWAGALEKGAAAMPVPDAAGENRSAATQKNASPSNGLARGGGEGEPAGLRGPAYLAFGTEASVVMRSSTSSLTAGA